MKSLILEVAFFFQKSKIISNKLANVKKKTTAKLKGGKSGTIS